MRNGSEAIAAARQACELTEWKNWQFIDTLAAAHAEAGKFPKAIEFQKQAMHTNKATERQQISMQQRLALYEKSKPFRERPARR